MKTPTSLCACVWGVWGTFCVWKNKGGLRHKHMHARIRTHVRRHKLFACSFQRLTLMSTKSSFTHHTHPPHAHAHTTQTLHCLITHVAHGVPITHTSACLLRTASCKGQSCAWMIHYEMHATHTGYKLRNLDTHNSHSRHTFRETLCGFKWNDSVRQ